MTTHVSLDFETYSESPLSGSHSRGLENYARHPSTEVLCLGYALGDDAPRLWLPNDPIPELFLNPVKHDVHWHAWNIGFEVSIMRHVLGWPVPDYDHQHDTMAKARALSLPGALGNCARVMRLPLSEQKDVRGRQLIQKLCKPDTKGVRNRDPELLQELYDYCLQDVVVEHRIDAILFDLSKSEKLVWRIDQEINERGIPVDMPNVVHALDIAKQVMDQLDDELIELTGIDNPNSNSQFRDWLNTRAVPVDNVKRDTLTRLLGADDQYRRYAYRRPGMLEADVRKAVVAFGHRKKTTINKFRAFARLAGPDDRVRNCFQYSAANTGRWASWGVNTQNLSRPHRALKDPNAHIELFAQRSPEALQAATGIHPIDVIGSAARGQIRARDGHRLIVADFSSIEAATTAFIAQEQYLIDIFKGDGRVYEAQASKMFNVSPDRVSSYQRLLGKVAVLALGFAGGKGAFASMAEVYGLEHLPEKETQGYVDAYRAVNPAIVNLWRSIEHAALNAVMHPTVAQPCANGYLQWVASDPANSNQPHVLYMHLPSGRLNAYWQPSIVEGKFGNAQLEFSGVNPETRQWGRTSGWRGLLTENAIQAIARDLLANALIQLHQTEYSVIMHVHDEIVCEVPEGVGSLQGMVDLMCRVPPWFSGFPLKADGYESKRYKKD